MSTGTVALQNQLNQAVACAVGHRTTLLVVLRIDARDGITFAVFYS
jgi:hypothetical protein